MRIEHFRKILPIQLIAAVGVSILSVEARASEELNFYSDSKSQSIELNDSKCEFLVDSTSNFRISLINKTLVIEALAQDTTGALLLVSCPGKAEQEFTLKFHNKNLAVEGEEDPYSIKNRPDSYLESKFSRSSNNETFMTNSWVDRSLSELEVRAQKSRSLNSNDHANNSLEITHRYSGNNVLYYGFSDQIQRASKNQSFRGGVGSDYINAGLDRTFFDNGNRADMYYFTLINPMSLQFVGKDNENGTWARSISKSWFFRSNQFTSRTTISGVSEDSGKQLRLNQGFTKLLTTDPNSILLNSKNIISCQQSSECQIRELAIGPTFKTGKIEVSYLHFLIPHFSLMVMQWKPNPRRSYKLSIRHKLPPLKWGVESLENTSTDSGLGDDRTNIDSDLSLLFREGLLQMRVDYQQPLLPKNSRKIASASLGLGQERDFFFWDLTMNQKIWDHRRGPSVVASIRAYTDYNLKRATLNLIKHRIRGIILSSVTKLPMAGVRIKLIQNGVQIQEVQSNVEGKYLFEGVPVSGPFIVSIDHDNYSASKSFVKDLRDTNLEQDIYVADFLVVKVQFILDSNDNGNFDPTDVVLNLPNEFPEIQDAIIKAEGANIATDQLLFKREKEIVFDLQESLLPNKFQLVAILPKKIDTVREKAATVTVLLRERND